MDLIILLECAPCECAPSTPPRRRPAKSPTDAAEEWTWCCVAKARLALVARAPVPAFIADVASGALQITRCLASPW